MAGLQPRRSEGNEPTKKPSTEKPEMSKLSPLAPTSQQAKLWAKYYRTAIAAGSSSILSTFVAVSVNYYSNVNEHRNADDFGSTPWTRSKLVCKRTSNQFSFTIDPQRADLDAAIAFSISRVVSSKRTRRRDSKAFGVVCLIVFVSVHVNKERNCSS